MTQLAKRKSRTSNMDIYLTDAEYIVWSDTWGPIGNEQVTDSCLDHDTMLQGDLGLVVSENKETVTLASNISEDGTARRYVVIGKPTIVSRRKLCLAKAKRGRAKGR